MSDKYILDNHKARRCADLLKWARWMETGDRRVAETAIGKSRVSTVFLGLDHSFGEGPPLLFETMVFGGANADYMIRSSTWEEAEAQHEDAIGIVTVSEAMKSGAGGPAAIS